MTLEPFSLTGKLFVVTGANTGIGRSTAEKLAAAGASIILACRSEERARPVQTVIRKQGRGDAAFVQLNLASLASVRACAAQVASLGRPIDCLINNAGLAGQRGLTEDGFEMTFGVNHLGHFLLTMLLLPALREAGAPRVVTVSSKAHYSASGIDFEAVRRPTRSIMGLKEYEISKLANVLFSAELAKRFAGKLCSYALHPGVIASDVWRRVPWPIRPLMKLQMLSNDEGAATTLFCATSPNVAAQSGLYYDECRVKEPSPVARDPELARQLWERSAEFTGLAGP